MRRAIECFCVFLAVLGTSTLRADEVSRSVQPGVPVGTIRSGVFSDSKVFPGTRRDYSVYVPAQYRAEQPANLMVFMDGNTYSKPDGPFRVPIVFDNLIHQKEMPVTIAVFVNPGVIPGTREGSTDRSNRSFEYDSLGDRYANFLLDEFLPVALRDLNVSADPSRRAVCGISSGAICAFTVAWERPEQFGKVLSHIGSYTNIRGGWAYPGLVRKTHKAPKPIKVYLQEGVKDLNNLHGNWPLGNQDLAAALQFAGYTHRLVMTEGGHSGQWAGEVFPDALRWLWNEAAVSDERPVIQTKPEWTPHADAIRKDNVPQGKVVDMPPFESKIFAGTTRDWSIYIPAQYTDEKPAALMIFQDGHSYRDLKGRFRVPIVFDNLIAKGEMPVTIAVFLNPGHDKTKEKPDSPWKNSNRGLEYDSLGDRYARFLLDEILPEVEKSCRISPDPEMRAICGASSGGICSWTVAWERPDAFRKVLSTIGSFTHLRGGNVYPSLIRKTEPKPIRVYLADTSGDIDNPFGSWWWANQQMASALGYMGYDTRFEQAEGFGHNADHGGAIFPDALRWLWRAEKHTATVDTSGDLGGDLTLLNLLIPGEGWNIAADGLGFADALCADAEGNVYFCDMKAPSIVKISAIDGSRQEICRESVSGLEFSVDASVLYACQGAKNRVISIAPSTGEVKVIAEGVKPNDLAVTRDGMILFTDTGTSRVCRINPETGEVSAVDEGISKPNGIAISNDGGTLAVSDYGGDSTWTFRVNAGGTLDAKMPTMPMRLPINPDGEFRFNEPPPYLPSSKGDGMAIDKVGRFYVTSELGVQIFDPTGRPCGLLPKPSPSEPLVTAVLAGPGHSTLYVANGTKVFSRKLTVEKPKN